MGRAEALYAVGAGRAEGSQFLPATELSGCCRVSSACAIRCLWTLRCSTLVLP